MATGTRANANTTARAAANPPGQEGRAAEPAPGVLPFSLTPRLYAQGVIDYSTKAGMSHYKGSTAKLEEELYDCTPDGFYQFIKSLGTRVKEYGWTAPEVVFWVALDSNQGTPKTNLLDYGRFGHQRQAKRMGRR